MLTIDGSLGEGGGQIVRTSLALSLITGKPFRIIKVRANRKPPGLKAQHLTAVRAAATIGAAQVTGAALGSRDFTFVPGPVSPGNYTFDVGTAGSTTLVLQTILPPLMLFDKPSYVRFQGGTHNIHAPPFDFLEKTFLPTLTRMGVRADVFFERYGFYPPGGGRFELSIEPAQRLQPVHLPETAPVQSMRARALVVKLPPGIAERELAVVRERLGWTEEQCEVVTSNQAISPGNVLTLEIATEHLTEVISGIGERGVRAEVVAERAVAEAERYLEIGAPVGEHLADQLLLPLALVGGGSFVTGPLSLHATTNIEVIKSFLDVAMSVEALDGERVRVTVG